MKNQNKKGFTLVELVIVIAVIAILAGVLIGTFATVISRANQSKAVQELKAIVDETYVEYVADAHMAPTYVKIVVTNGKFVSIEFGNAAAEGFVALKTGYYTSTASEATSVTDSNATYHDDNSYFLLDSANKVYLLWNEAGEASTYMVAASNDSTSAATGLYSRSGENSYADITDLRKLTLNGVVYYGK